MPTFDFVGTLLPAARIASRLTVRWTAIFVMATARPVRPGSTRLPALVVRRRPDLIAHSAWHPEERVLSPPARRYSAIRLRGESPFFSFESQSGELKQNTPSHSAI